MWLRLVLVIPVLCADLLAQSVPSDYQAFFRAEQAALAGQHKDVLAAAEIVNATRPESPLRGRMAVLAARSLLVLGRASDSLAALSGFPPNLLPQPDADGISGQAAEAAGNRALACAYWQKVYYGYPRSPLAAPAYEALQRLRATLGRDYPEVMPAAVFDRAEKLRRAGDVAQARVELLSASKDFGGVDRDLAIVRAHTGDYRNLAALKVSSPEADAERLYLMHAVSRRNSQVTQAEAALRGLEAKYPESSWTAEALTSWGNHWLLRNEPAQFLPLYRKCATRDYCAWKVAWHSWISRAPDGRAALDKYLLTFPKGEKAAAALYFLGRHREAVERFPMSWYAVLAESKGSVGVQGLKPDPSTWNANATLKARIGRARQLEVAALHDWSEFELRFGASDQPYVAASELAAMAAARGDYEKSLRTIKSIARDYLTFALDGAPERFWKLAFPLPWRSELEAASRTNQVDPFLMAALIRQESEFNPRAISRARAYGLTQVLPSTGRAISRRAGVYGFSTDMLLQPDVSLRIGAHYLRSMLDAHRGQVHLTLASYNAGKSRTDQWLGWYDYREPAEFVETIPFTETRTYVQAVLRNAAVYRKLYGKSGTPRASSSYAISGD